MTNKPELADLRKIVEDSVRHARSNVGFTLNSPEAAEQNISMNVETIMAAFDQELSKRVEKQVLSAFGHSETRLVHYVSEFDGSYCYTELVEGESDMHFLRVANSYDAGFDDWQPFDQLSPQKTSNKTPDSSKEDV